MTGLARLYPGNRDLDGFCCDPLAQLRTLHYSHFYMFASLGYFIHRRDSTIGHMNVCNRQRSTLQRYGHSRPAGSTRIAFHTIMACHDNLLNNPDPPRGVVQITSKGLDQVCTIHTFSSLQPTLCSAYSITQGFFITAPPFFLSGQHGDDASEQRSFLSFPSHSKLADDTPAVLFVDPSLMEGVYQWARILGSQRLHNMSSNGRLYKRYAIDEERVMSACDEEHDVLRAWRIIERSGVPVMNHAYLNPNSRHVSN